ncbi:hypothetical protein ACFQZZ_09800 [Nocardia sp. GCM10030253]
MRIGFGALSQADRLDIACPSVGLLLVDFVDAHGIGFYSLVS